jgi:uncharacterized protein (DUF1499 family)
MGGAYWTVAAPREGEALRRSWMMPSVAAALLAASGLLYPVTDAAAQALERCPPSPNCVSSRTDPSDADHHVPPFVLKGDFAAAWERLRTQVEALPRTTVISDSGDVIQLVIRSFVFRFPDDVAFSLERSTGRVDVRSASRYGYSDFGVNRRRIEDLRDVLRREGIVE